MKKLIPIIVLFVGIFFYRQDIQEFTKIHVTTQDDPFEWLDTRRESLFADLPSMEFSTAISALQDLSKEIHENLESLEKLENSEKTSFRRRLECELAVIYRKMADQYLQHGDDDNYMRFIQLQQAQLRVCSNLKETGQEF